MPSRKKERRAVAKALRKARDKHEELLGRLEKAKVKFEKRAEKLKALEARIAELETEYYQPELERLGQADAGDKELIRARMIYNPASAQASKGVADLKKIVGALRAHGILAEVGVKTSGKAARDMAKEAADNGEELVIVAAGDGTIEDVATQLVGTKTALGIIPIGTMNNLARSLGVPLDAENASALIGMGATRLIDIGHVLAQEKPDVEYFLETAGAGLSAIVIPAGQAAEKGRWSEIPQAIRKLFEVKPELVTIQLDHGDIIEAQAQVVTVSNAPMMGSNILIAPDAKMDDGLLDVCVFNRMGKTELLTYFMAASGGKRSENPNVNFYRARHVRIETPRQIPAHSDKDVVPTKPLLKKGEPAEQDAPLIASAKQNGDSGANGDVHPHYVLEVEVVPGAVKMIVGKGIGLSLPVEAVPVVPPLSGPQPQDDTKPEQEKK